MNGTSRIEANGRSYDRTEDAVVVVCINGSEPTYHERAAQAGRMPFFEKLTANGTSNLATCAMPSFTNPNNLSIATGAPPSVHGIRGNYFFDRNRAKRS